MESGEGPPREEIRPEDLPLPEDDPFETTSYNQHWLDFLEKFDTYKTNEYKMENYPDTFKNLPTIDPIRKNTLSKLQEMRKDIFDTLYEKYLGDDTERQKVLANRDSYKPFDTKNEDIEDFMELSKNIAQLEKGVYTETNKELMFVLVEDPDTPTKNTLKKILDYLKDKKYPLLFTMLMAGLFGLFIDLEKELNKASKKVKELIAKQLMRKVKDELTLGLLKAQDAIIQATKKYLIFIVLVIIGFVYYKSK